MGKASRTKQEPDRRARIAAQREAERRAEQRERIYLAGGSILVVVIVVLAFVLVKLNSGGGTAAPASNGPTGTALASVTKQVTDVPTSVTDQVAGGGVPAAFFVAAKTSSAVSSLSSSLGSYFAHRQRHARSPRTASPRCCTSAASTARSAPRSAGRWSTRSAGSAPSPA